MAMYMMLDKGLQVHYYEHYHNNGGKVNDKYRTGTKMAA